MQTHYVINSKITYTVLMSSLRITVSETGTVLGLLRIVGSIFGLFIGGGLVAKFNLTGEITL